MHYNIVFYALQSKNLLITELRIYINLKYKARKRTIRVDATSSWELAQ